jgi:predicted nuclease of predicted toxin-antitoxin system
MGITKLHRICACCSADRSICHLGRMSLVCSAGATDTLISEYATEHGFIVVTKDEDAEVD